MTAETILYISIAGVISLGVSLFMYGYKSKLPSKLRWALGLLRALSIFIVLVLIINPKFTSKTYYVEKPVLSVLVDNSISIEELEYTDVVSETLTNFKNNEALEDAFNVAYYKFGSSLSELDSLSFSERNTNITEALTSVDAINTNNNATTIIITDGNQTLGSDYEFASKTLKNPVYPVIVGDSSVYVDLKIEQLNSNRYAYIKNRFPIEILAVYSGTSTVNTQFVVTQGNSTVYKEPVSFSPTENSKTINFTLPATKVGIQKYRAQLVPLSEEKNKINNTKQFAVEVIDQATNVLLVSKLMHPDLGALKKAITSSEQRKLDIKEPSEALSVLDNYQLVILYQPDRFFSSLYQEIEKLGKNTFTITGTNTDWNFLNSIQNNFEKEVSNATEEVFGELNPDYTTFAVEANRFNDLPPLETLFGTLSIKVPHEILLYQTVGGINNESPLLTTIEQNNQKQAIWDGENIWKWRASAYIANGSFEDFDQFMAKLTQYLASNKRRSRLEVTTESFYYNNAAINISAQYFDKNFVFDSRASLEIVVTNKDSNYRETFPLLLKNNYYEVNLNSLPSGDYSYTVSVSDASVSRSGNFTIVDFNVEQQFLNAAVTKLTKLATNTGGDSFFISDRQKLIDNLLTNDSFKPVQKSEQNIVPLIEWKYLLGILVLLLGLEWFIRKFNGLI